jgi:hypothetical protein
VKRKPGLTLILIGAVAMIAACNRAPESNEAVRQAIMQHLSKNAALDMNQLDVEMRDVKFEGSQATANVAIKPKASPDQGMTMTYTLVRRGSEWQVQGKGAGHGAGMGAAPPAGAGTDLPSGHPPVSSPGGTPSGELPAGHPPVNAPPPQK